MFSTKDQRSWYVPIESLERRELLSGEPWGWQAQMIGQDLAVANYPTITGAGQTIAVIDSGVDYAHPALGGGIGSGFKVIGGYDFVSGDADPMSDTNAHGTGSAGIAAADSYVYKGFHYQGIAPDANVIALRENGTTGVKAALDWVLANRAKYNIVAVNMVDFGGGSALTYKASLQSLIAAGVFVSHPAGNAGASVPIGAALDPADFSVGSVGSSGALSSFSQRGAELDLVAPGEQVTLPYYDTATGKHIYVDTADGTSWASPAVVGTAALIKQIDPRFTPGQIMQIMQDSGTPTYDAVSKLTYKRLNVNGALALAYARRPGTPQAPDSQPPVEAPNTGEQSAYTAVTVLNSGATTIQAENYDTGGEGIAFHDTDATNLGCSTYRSGAGVDVQDGSGGTHYVGFVRVGEWLEYTLNVSSAGTYDLTAKVASLRSGGKFHVEVDGTDKTGTLSVPDTKDWQNWATVGKAGVALSAGTHVIRIKADAAGALGYVANFDSITVAPSVAAPVTPPSTTTSFAARDARNFSAQSGVSIGSGYIGGLDAGDWVAYRGIDFGSGGATSFAAGIAAANGYGGRTIELRLDSPTGAVIGTITVPTTGGGTDFKTIKVSISKVTQVHDVYLTFAGGTSVGNVSWFKFA